MPSLEDRGPSQAVRPLTLGGTWNSGRTARVGHLFGAPERRLLTSLRGASFFAEDHRGAMLRPGAQRMWDKRAARRRGTGYSPAARSLSPVLTRFGWIAGTNAQAPLKDGAGARRNNPCSRVKLSS